MEHKRVVALESEVAKKITEKFLLFENFIGTDIFWCGKFQTFFKLL